MLHALGGWVKCSVGGILLVRCIYLHRKAIKSPRILTTTLIHITSTSFAAVSPRCWSLFDYLEGLLAREEVNDWIRVCV